MAEQNRDNYKRRDWKFHYSLVPLFVFNLLWAVWRLFESFHIYAVWSIVLSSASLFMLFVFRTYSVQVQDRVIRLEERLRIVPLLPASVRTRWAELTVPQLIALRFANDAEVGALAERAITEKLDPKAIRAAIQVWRPDHMRV